MTKPCTHTQTSNMQMLCTSYNKTHDYLLYDLVEKTFCLRTTKSKTGADKEKSLEEFFR